MNSDSLKELQSSALDLKKEIDSLDEIDAILRRAREILLPLIRVSLEGDVKDLPLELPSRRYFFFGMQDDCLAGTHLEKSSLLNAIGRFADALESMRENK